ncbi:MAG: DUF3617 domain-containing protein, partial [Croceibacterium sp.]
MTKPAFLPLIALCAPLFAPLFALAACNSQPTVEATNASVEDVAKQVADASGSDSFVSPGKWQSTYTIEEMTMPGMDALPASVRAQIRSRTPGPQTTESCLTEADVKNPREKLFAHALKDCTYDHFRMAGGTMDSEMTCTLGGASTKMTMTGTYAPDHYTTHTT